MAEDRELVVSEVEPSKITVYEWLWDSNGAAKKLALVMLVCFVVKCLVAWRFPLLGDEAYFALCAKRLSGGQYDHPPMLAWILHWVLDLGKSPLLLRLPAVVFSTALAAGVYALLKPFGQRNAYLAALLFLVAPFNLAFFIITTDTPLFLFSFLSVFLLFKAEREESGLATKAQRHEENGNIQNPLAPSCLGGESPKSKISLYYLLSGVFLGLAFLSKYFAVMLGFSYVLYFLSVRKTARRIKGFALLVLGTVPFVVQNAVWNYHNGWPNIMHNWVNRLTRDANPAVNLLCLALFLLYLMTLPVVQFLFEKRTAVLRLLRQESLRLFVLICLVPVIVFVAASFEKSVGPHWYVSFLPFVFVIAALVLDAEHLIRCVRFSLTFSLIQSCIVLAVPFVPAARLQGILKDNQMTSLVTYMYPEKLAEPLLRNKDNFVCAATGYSMAATLEYVGGQRVIVFGKGTHHARQDDILTNFKELDGKDFVILSKGRLRPEQYEPCFEKIEIKPLQVEGATFNLIFGFGFKYAEYREQYLRLILKAYYRIPSWLPYSRSFFHEKYDFGPGG